MQTNEEVMERYQQIAHKQIADALGYTPAAIRRSLHTPTSPLYAMLQLVVDSLVAKLQVDDVLTVNWISVNKNNYRVALNDLITYNIQLENDPAVTHVARGITGLVKQVFKTMDEYESKKEDRSLTPNCVGFGYPGPVLAAIAAEKRVS